MRTALILASLLLAGCGSFPLGTSYPQNGQAPAQIEQDILVCKDRAAVADSTSERQAVLTAKAFIPLAGIPMVVNDSRSYQRAVFTQCMTARGYRVEQDGRMP
jgi:uncharacterized lipoprotein YajG